VQAGKTSPEEEGESIYVAKTGVVNLLLSPAEYDILRAWILHNPQL
jgi:hypothetical protein